MKVTCNSCEQAITVDESKAPAGSFRIKCPSCSNLITVTREEPAAAQATVSPASMSEVHSNPANNVEEIVKHEVAKAKKEIFEALATIFGADISNIQNQQDKELPSDEHKRALICESEQPTIDQVTTVLKRLGYQIDSVKTSADALKKLDQFTYQLVAVSSNLPDAKEGAAKILGRINGQKSAQRRQTFVISISNSAMNTDATTAFLHGANIIVNKDDLGRLESLILEGRRRFQQIYHHFSELLLEKEQL
jgi:predicted Zn finger-like uncharacterized protein